jgi:ABC-type transport system involved in cytochrome c biogenesis permease subunit
MEKGLKFLKELYSARAALISGTVLLALMLIVGLFAPEGMTRSPLFTGVLLCFGALCTLRAVEDFRRPSLRNLPRAVFHGAVAIILVAGVFSRVSKVSVVVETSEGEAVAQGVDDDGNAVRLPFGIRLRDFSMEYYPSEDGRRVPKSFLSEIDFILPGGRTEAASVSVNHPARACGWMVYQYDYDEQAGPAGTRSSLLCVRDPWYPAIAAGLWLLLLSGLGLIFSSRLRHRWILPVSAAFAGLFIWIIWRRMHLGEKMLVPALQSIWFVPHVSIYMFAYAVMATVTLYAVVRLLIPRPSDREREITSALVRIGWGLLTIGMVTGALWAKQAWGDWWGWDPKETWAAATWMCYMLWMHSRSYFRGRRTALLLLIFAFLMLQMCWWGVNYLPSARELSVHTY